MIIINMIKETKEDNKLLSKSQESTDKQLNEVIWHKT